jgi:hypothetical protein
VGWFSRFKLHLVVNDRGELLAFCPPGNVDYRWRSHLPPQQGALVRAAVSASSGRLNQNVAPCLRIRQNCNRSSSGCTLTNTVLVNRHFASIDELEDAQVARVVELRNRRDLVRSAT